MVVFTTQLVLKHDREEGAYTIPLYTHPAKESKAKDRFSNYESICLQCGTTIYKPAFNTLTDEEILREAYYILMREQQKKAQE
jgi:hypothetical protein